ncbi:diguanylate cyclase [Granulicella arctica]|uniref:diguanylate cyclase n=1 Tax=Granulicella arctica TaxID=940613 RepID=A0A7Y9THM9_9BACT|nr:diguanylate cyclase (GGDEF)-like protein [Granulicella arctica]
MILTISALTAVASICAGGLVVYARTQHLIETRNLMDHSQTILTALQTTAQRIERIDDTMQLYQAAGDPDRLQSARSTAATTDVSMLRLQELVQDNPSQTRHTHELTKAVQSLVKELNDTATRTVPERSLLECRNIVNIMQEEERRLFRQRSDESQNSLSRSLLSGAGYSSFSMLVVGLLFAFLFRDALNQRSFEAKLSEANATLEETVEKLRQRAAEEAMLTNAHEEIQLCVSAKQAYPSILRHLEMLLPGSSGAILTINNSRRMVEIMATWNHPEQLADGFELDACCGLRAGRTRWRKPGVSEVHCKHFTGNPPENYLCLPMAAYGETLGFIYIHCPDQTVAAIAQQRMTLLHDMVELASISIASLNLRAKLENQSIRDPLTGLFNRHFMEIALEREMHRVMRRNSSLALFMIDVDHFKNFNDTFGHEAGDAILRDVADSFRQVIRSEDIVCRYGGEEFIMILPEITQEIALERAEIIRKRVAGIRVHYRGELLRSISVSIGVGMFPGVATNGNDLIRTADLALYRAKAMGRDQVQLAEPIESQVPSTAS